MATGDYKEVSAVARQRRDASISAFYGKHSIDHTKIPNNLVKYSVDSGFYNAAELEIIQSEAVDILNQISERRWTALEVTQAFCKASAIAQELTNCLTETLYPEAIERAKYLDRYLAETGKTVGPLHGLPVSLKDSLITAPHPSSIGLAAFANEPTIRDSTLVNVLRDLGAVFYVKTNIPTAMMMAETINNVWGECINPLHKRLSPGGSSGGEGALIAMNASPLGVGTDIGGSIRIPSAWCHLYGLKPSFGRFPVSGGKTGIPGQEFVLAVNGPMARSLQSIQLYCESVLSEHVAPWSFDHKCLPIPWRQNVIRPSGRKLRLGMVGTDDGLVTCHPPVERALKTVQKSLTDAGHELVPWSTDLHEAIVKNLMAAFFDLGGPAIASLLEPFQEPVFESMEGYVMAAKAEAVLTSTKMRQMVLKRNELQQLYMDQWAAYATKGGTPIDGFIMAVAPWAAARRRQARQNFYVGYTGVVNFLDFCACTFPVTFVDRELDRVRDPRTFHQLNDLDGRIQADYDPEFYHGAPVGLQLVGKRLEEEKVLEMVEMVSKVLKG